MIYKIIKILKGIITKSYSIHTLDISNTIQISEGSVISRGCHISSNVSIGCCSKLSQNVFIGSKCSIGSYTSINRNTIVDYADIGNFVSIGPNCHIGPGNHAIDYVSTSQRLYGNNNILGVKTNFEPYIKKTLIGHDVWVGTGAIIMQGISIGNGAVIGAGSVVTHDVPPYSIYVGNPAHFLRNRFSEDDIAYLEEARFFDYQNGLKIEVLKRLINKESNWSKYK